MRQGKGLLEGLLEGRKAREGGYSIQGARHGVHPELEYDHSEKQYLARIVRMRFCDPSPREAEDEEL